MTYRHDPATRRPRDLLRHYLGDLVYGANDGLVTTFTVVSGVAGAGLSSNVVVILGLVNLVADGFSMGASSFLSIRSAAGVEGRDRGIREPLLHSAATFGAFLVAGFVPLLSHLVPGWRDSAYEISCVLAGITMFAVAALRSAVTNVTWMRTGLEMLFVGAAAAGVAFGVGSMAADMIR
jgi:VIT1/CCC1 family predicted Fe2+/Mn2+ transporter